MCKDFEAMRARIRDFELMDEPAVIDAMLPLLSNYKASIDAIEARAISLIEHVRGHEAPTLMVGFLNEYGLSTKEGIALMCLAEALLRVPDEETIDALISDKIAPSAWGEHLGKSSSSLVNASTWALMLTGSVLSRGDAQGLISSLRGMVKRLGEPVVRTAVGQAMKELGRHFVLGRNIDEAMAHAEVMQARGYRYSYDMLGEAARTDEDAKRYHIAYSDAIASIAKRAHNIDVRDNPGISIKLSALHPRFEMAKRDQMLGELTARARSLAILARSANFGLSIDAEEADRLDLSLDVIEAMLNDPALAGWDGFGVVVQAYGRRALPVIDWIEALARKFEIKIAVRLVKGAYWDTEIKRAQSLGLASYPVFTRKSSTDISFIACAAKLLSMREHLFAQIATHNAHSMAAVMEIAQGSEGFEFQRLHGMGSALHAAVLDQCKAACRIYAPVGEHRDLLAYLVRRLLENGANSSFVYQIVDHNVMPTTIARDPLAQLEDGIVNTRIPAPADLYGAHRRNAIGFDLAAARTIKRMREAIERHRRSPGQASSLIAGERCSGSLQILRNPAMPEQIVGEAYLADCALIEKALGHAQEGAECWARLPASRRSAILAKIADLLEAHFDQLFVLCIREAGKCWADALAEIREAVDFCRYYADQATDIDAAGLVSCISPWNFPLAIFTGQIAGALAAGNAVLAKPAEQTPLIACRAVELMHLAGVPPDTLQLLLGDGGTVGRAITSDQRVTGVCFTGSTETARQIAVAMADNLAPAARLIAETGGLNAMIVDSTALPEQAVRDIVTSAFQSAGQRCSALRMLYVQKDVADHLLVMLQGAMDCLEVDDPSDLATDVGPVIDAHAKSDIDAYIAAMKSEGRLIKQLSAPAGGYFVGPALIRLDGIEQLKREVFGPVLHVATYQADHLGDVVDAINASGYGLTLGIHSRIDDRVQTIVERARIGNIYVNRNQIGAIVGSQPFGGEGLSGTGPKAGGPAYVDALRPRACPAMAHAGSQADHGASIEATALIAAIKQLRPTVDHRALRAIELPGTTGESNKLSWHARGLIFCLGSDAVACEPLIQRARMAGNLVVAVAPGLERASDIKTIRFDGVIDFELLSSLDGIDGVAASLDIASLKQIRKALAERDGPILPLLLLDDGTEHYRKERHLSIDTTAAGGNASLLAQV